MPVAVVAAMAGAEPGATTVSSFFSLSVDPPLVAVALDRESNTLQMIRDARRFSINVLSADQERTARACATKEPGKLEDVAWSVVDGVPRLEGVAVWLACDLEASYDGGDHEMLVGLVTDVVVDAPRPLLYHGRAFAVPAPVHVSPRHS
jgi:flavin reductase (DIM6/NTAB) family NADH-FMN oxidoreductase RutF